MSEPPTQTDPLRIDNSAYAGANILFGRVLPGLVIASSIWSLLSLKSDGPTRGTVVPALLALLLIAYMIVSYVRRGRHPAVMSIEFLPDCLNVNFSTDTASFNVAQIRAMEYEGTRNPARVGVLNAVFPQNDDRILVVTLADEIELRVQVQYEHDAPLKAFAAARL